MIWIMNEVGSAEGVSVVCDRTHQRIAADSVKDLRREVTSGDARVELGMALRRERKEKGISQEQLAFECELHRTYVGSVERGERNVSLDNIVLLAKALGLKPSELLRRAGL